VAVRFEACSVFCRSNGCFTQFDFAVCVLTARRQWADHSVQRMLPVSANMIHIPGKLGPWTNRPAEPHDAHRRTEIMQLLRPIRNDILINIHYSSSKNMRTINAKRCDIIQAHIFRYLLPMHREVFWCFQGYERLVLRTSLYAICYVCIVQTYHKEPETSGGVYAIGPVIKTTSEQCLRCDPEFYFMTKNTVMGEMCIRPSVLPPNNI
jgi:hypothetical protein